MCTEWQNIYMRTTIVIDDDLIRAAMQATGLRTKKAIVEAGLALLIQVKGQTELRKLRGKVMWNGDLDDMRYGRISKCPS